MRLIALSANRPSFQTVRFNPRGPSFILAQQRNPESSDSKRTYNGVGKSLIIALIHFCLGSGKKKEFETALPGWKFSLRFEIGGKTYTATRATEQQDDIDLNGTVYSPRKLGEALGARCFEIPDSGKNLTWRTLLPAFIRSNRAAYFDFDKFGGTRNDDQKQIVNSFLLGLDTDLIRTKLTLREEQDRVRKLTDNFKKDTVLKDFFTGSRDVTLSIAELNDQIGHLERDLAKFEVAEDYYDIKNQADAAQHDLNDLSNRLVLLRGQTAAIDRSLAFSPDLGREKIEQVYIEAKFYFPDNVKSTLSDVERFHRELAQHREKRLSEQKRKIIKEISTLEEKAQKDRQALDSLLQYLGAHHALDVFVSLSNKLADLRNQLENLKAYETMRGEYSRHQRKLKERFIEENRRSDEYLQEIKAMLDENRKFFRSLSKRFYPDSPSGITVSLNEGENKTRFNIDAKIESDSSGGINNVKIFCYDLTLLFKRHNHRIHFIFHDSRLFDGIDERQKTEMIKVVGDLFRDSDNQYIATMNQNQLEEIRRHLPPDQLEEIIEKNRVLTLTDGSPEEKLLGINVDLSYE